MIEGIIRSTAARSRLVQVALLTLVALGVMTSLALLSAPAEAATTFTVTETGDDYDIDLSNARCDTSTDAGDQCTLRAAIEEANDTAGADTIDFDIGAGTGAKTISPTSGLPTITDAVAIDGYTQAGASENTLEEGNDTDLKVQLDGSDAIGLRIDASDCTIEGLVIKNFNAFGVLIESARATGNRVEGNSIGTTADGTGDLGNVRGGVTLQNGPDFTAVGGTLPGAANRIAHNGENGVSVVDTSDVTGSDAEGNYILSNAIFDNGGLGIDLEGGTEDADGVTSNDTGDLDTGPNKLQNFPVKIRATRSNSTGRTTISGRLNSNPAQDFLIQCFLTGEANASDHGEGSRLLDTEFVSTDADGKVGFTCDSPRSLLSQLPGQTVSATATNVLTADTSEFSKNVSVTTGP